MGCNNKVLFQLFFSSFYGVVFGTDYMSLMSCSLKLSGFIMHHCQRI